MSDSLVEPLAAPLWDSAGDRLFRDHHAVRLAGHAAVVERTRAPRLRMRGSGYRAAIDGRDMTLINLSLSGAQLRGLTRVVPDQPMIVTIGWPQGELVCSALARVRWVQVESTRPRNELAYRIGLAFETWDVRRLKEIMHHSRGASSPRPEVDDPW